MFLIVINARKSTSVQFCSIIFFFCIIFIYDFLEFSTEIFYFNKLPPYFSLRSLYKSMSWPFYFLKSKLHVHNTLNSLNWKQKVNFNKLPPYFSLRRLYKSMSSYPSLISLLLEDCRDDLTTWPLHVQFFQPKAESILINFLFIFPFGVFTSPCHGIHH